MRQLSDILEEKIKKVGGKASLGRVLGVSGPAIFQYTQGAMPSLDVAIKWKQEFNENLIDLMFAEDNLNTTIVKEPTIDNGNDLIAGMQREIKAMNKAIESQDKLIEELKHQLDECRSRNNQVPAMKK